MTDPSESERYLTDAPDRRRGGWLLAVVALVVLAAFAAAIWFAYNRGVETGAALSPPLIRAEPGPTKVRPDEPGGLEVPHQDKLVFETLTPNKLVEGAEHLLPPPEEPVSRPEPAPPADAETLAPAEPVEAVEQSTLATLAPPPSPAAKETAPDEIGPSEALVAEPSPARPDVPPSPRSVATAEPTMAPRPPPAGEVAPGGFRIQLAAYRDAGAATRGWHLLAKANPTLLRLLTPNVIRVDLGPGKGVFYRLQAGSLPDRAAADALCAKLKDRKVGCLVVE